MPNDSQLDQLSPAKRAVYEIRRLRSRIEELERLRDEPVAVIGMGLRMPKNTSTPDAFWKLLTGGVDAVTEIPSTRWPVEQFYHPDPDAPGKMYTRHGAFMEGPAYFDAEFFGISPREAALLDPQHRVALEVAWEALENAGYNPSGLTQKSTGVFLAFGNSDYHRMAFRRADEIDAYTSTGNLFSVAAGRISYALGLQGPSVALDTACSGSLVAVHLACQSLRSRDCGLALAGGVNLILSPEVHINFSKSRMLARDGRCKSFDSQADGYGRGEGCGFLVLKLLSEAQADRDQILAVIRGSAVNQDGRSGGLTVPSGPAQVAVIRDALTKAQVEPERIGYVETHGTGTALGDPIEAHALVAALGGNRSSDNPLVIGSVKTNIGHLEAAAGVAGLVKAILALQHREIPANLHFRTLNPNIDWGGVPVEIPVATRAWPAGAMPRMAGVSSFGLSGTNAHVIVEEAPVSDRVRPDVERPLHILAVSARSAAALNATTDGYRAALAQEDCDLPDLCYTVNAGRAHFLERAVYVGESTQDILHQPVVRGTVETSPDVVFLFPDEAGRYDGMGKELYATQPVFRRAVDDCTAHGHTELFAVEYALAQLWINWGVRPSAVIGYGAGEHVAATVAGTRGLAVGPGSEAGVRESSAADDRFRDALAALPREKHRVFLEVGPGTTLTSLGRQYQPDGALAWLPSLRQGRSEWYQILESLSRLYVAGAEINWEGFDSPYSRRRTSLPTYPFERRRYWLAESPVIPPWESVRDAAEHQSRQCPLDLRVETYPERWRLLDRLTLAYIVEAFRRLGVFRNAGERQSAKALLREFRIADTYGKLMGRWLRSLSDAGLIKQEGDEFIGIGPLPAQNIPVLLAEATTIFGAERIFLDYVTWCGERLRPILTGELSPLETLFPGGDFGRAEDLYEHAPLSRYFSSIARAAVEGFVRSRGDLPVRLLEIGAGTGATTAAVLPVLRPTLTSYHFTDVSQWFLDHGARKFAEHPLVRFGIFDIERTGASQGYANGGYDVILATNALHATRDILTTLLHVRSLLAPGGIFVLCEATTYLSWFDITTALVEGWQAFDDEFRGEHPLLAVDEWRKALLASGFESLEVYPGAGSAAEVLGQHVMVAQVSRVEMPIRSEPAARSTVPEIADVPKSHDQLLSLVRLYVSELLGMDSGSVPRKARLIDLGLDSLMAVALRDRIVRALALDASIPATLVFDHPTVEAIAAHLWQDVLHKSVEEEIADASADQMAVRAGELEQLADEDVESLLRARLQSL